MSSGPYGPIFGYYFTANFNDVINDVTLHYAGENGGPHRDK